MNTNKLDTLCYKNSLKCNAIIGVEATASDIKKRISKIKKYKKQLDKLLKLPKIEQKTDEWYKVRQNLVTASDFAQALGDGKFGSTKQFYQKKCEPAEADSSVAGKTNPFFKWGNMFEQVAIDIYSDMFEIPLHNFGLLQHQKHKFFGASPDAISDVGIMVEIKCPKKRKIVVGGEVPLQYYYQIQGQLDVCELDECDYFECDFGLYDVSNDFFDNLAEYEYRGIISESQDGLFEYSNLNYTKDELYKWANNNNNKKYYWYLNLYNINRVVRDKKFLEDKMKKLEIVWNNVLCYRENPEKYNVEVLKSIDIKTTPLYTKKITEPKINGWSFIDVNE
jgi:putative phage-type endonuclease